MLQLVVPDALVATAKESVSSTVAEINTPSTGATVTSDWSSTFVPPSLVLMLIW